MGHQCMITKDINNLETIQPYFKLSQNLKY